VWTRYEFVGKIPITAAANLRFQLAPGSGGSVGDTLLCWQSRMTQVDLEMISLHRVLDTAALVADGTGTLTAWVEPELPASLTTEALVQLYLAKGKFRLADFQLPVSAANRVRPGQASF